MQKLIKMKETQLSGLTCYSAKSMVARSPFSDKLNCLILESDPAPGYYAKNNFPVNKHVHDWHLYLPIKKQIVCFQDVILRNASILSAQFIILSLFKGNLPGSPVRRGGEAERV